jgi:mannose-6-phosphate isomerase-like protein (cupin superfamily)
MFNRTTTEKIAELKALRKQAVNNFNDLSRLKNEELAEYFYCKFQEGQDVPYSLLAVIPVNHILQLPVVRGGVIITTKVDHMHRGIARFITNWTPGSTLTWHFHSDANELILVKKGMLKVYLEGATKILKEGQSIQIAHGIGHQITALEDTELEVDFIKIHDL